MVNFSACLYWIKKNEKSFESLNIKLYNEHKKLFVANEIYGLCDITWNVPSNIFEWILEKVLSLSFGVNKFQNLLLLLFVFFQMILRRLNPKYIKNPTKHDQSVVKHDFKLLKTLFSGGRKGQTNLIHALQGRFRVQFCVFSFNFH